LTDESRAAHTARRIVVTTLGSLGDLHPYLAIALGLRVVREEAVRLALQSLETMTGRLEVTRRSHPGHFEAMAKNGHYLLSYWPPTKG
jgi:hypothetical protein